jgi:M6 family metalloprotease-like protein
MKTLTHIIMVIAMIFLPLSANARRAHGGMITMQQPDGSLFQAKIQGDEFLKIITSGGSPIIQNEDGWYEYATYQPDGTKTSTGIRVGSGSPPLSSIPYEQLTSLASRHRALKFNEPQQLTKSDQAQKRQALILLVEFTDKKFTHTKEEFNNMLNMKGYSEHGAQGSAKDYFDAQFQGRYEFIFEVSDIITVPNELKYYGSNSKNTGTDINAHKLIVDAVELADKDFNFADFDNDSDGIVDNIFVFFAGGDEAEGAGDNTIWSHAWSLKAAGEEITLDGVELDTYACASELTRISYEKYRMTGIGTFCHEYSHTFGLADLYDTDYEASSGMSAGVWGKTSLMDNGNYNDFGNCPPNYNAIERYVLGLGSAVVLEEGIHTLKPIQNSNTYYICPTENSGEFFLFECRNNEGWDREIGGSGMLIYHVDMSTNAAGYADTYGFDMTAQQRWRYNLVNANCNHQCANLIEADARNDQGDFSLENITDIFFPHTATSSFSPNSNPAFKVWSGEEASHSIIEMAKDGENIIIKVKRNGANKPPTAEILKTEVYQNEAILNWKASKSTKDKAYLVWGETNGTKSTTEVNPTDTVYTAVLRNLKPKTAYKAEIYYILDGVPGESKTFGFTTKTFTEGNTPYIYVKNCARTQDGSFKKGEGIPLHVYNALNAEKIDWYYNNQKLTQVSGYFRPQASGTLKAVVWWKDGSQDIIKKHIEIKDDERSL